MAETEDVTAPRRRRFKPTEIVMAILFVVLCVILIVTLTSQLRLHHELNAAKAISNRAINDIAKQDATDARKLGDSGFQKSHSAADLTSLFQQIAQHAHGTPVIDRTIVNNDRYGQAVGVIYKYPGKPVFYIRVIATQPKGASSWHMTGLSGNPSEAALVD